MKNKVTDFALERQKRQKEIFRRPDSCWNIFLKSLRASAKVYTPVVQAKICMPVIK
jgi:hypothetical protein